MILNLNTQLPLAEFPVTAIGFIDRLRGMIWRDFQPDKMDAMVFPRCNCVHGCFMKIPLDLVFLDAGSRIAAMKSPFLPWSLPCGCRKAVTVIELPVGAIAKSRSSVGDVVNVNSILDVERLRTLPPELEVPNIICRKEQCRVTQEEL